MNAYESIPRQFPANAALDLMPLPGESMVSSLWRFSWRNGLSTKELLSFCTKGSGYEKEDAACCSTWGFDADVFLDASGWVNPPQELQIFGAPRAQSRSLWWSRGFRYCPICLEHLYHSFWHQSIFLSHCPLDGVPLLDKCYCCHEQLPAYGFRRKVLSRPYLCLVCKKSISGIKISLEARLSIQQRKKELKGIFDVLERWWLDSSAARDELASLLPSRGGLVGAPWLRPDVSMRQWVIDRVPPPAEIPVATRTLPSLVVIKWKVKLEPDDPMAFIWARRQTRDEKLNLASQVYRATMRRLMQAIARDAPFDDADYRRHYALPVRDLVSAHRDCNLKLLALIMLRRSYETYFSQFAESGEEARLDAYSVGFPYGNEFALRVRICWRAQFIAEYASFYWWLVAVRDGRKGVKEFRRETATLSDIDVKFDHRNGDVVAGSVAFPAVDGLHLDLFP